MINGREIDAAELAKLTREARDRNQFSQRDVAHQLGIYQGWVSQVELQKANLHEGASAHVSELAKLLDFEVPYVGGNPIQAETPSPSRAETKKEVSIPKMDDELSVIQACGAELQKLGDSQSIDRVLSYLHARYVAEHI